MRELSHHILDIGMNSVRGEASKVDITIEELIQKNQLIITIADNGKGITPDMLATIKNPFTTSRTMRKVGLGIPLLNDTCRNCDGSLEIDSHVGVGTTLVANMAIAHIDRPPIGDVGATISSLMSSYPDINICFKYITDKDEFTLSTEELLEELDGLSIQSVAVVSWLKGFINDNIKALS